MSKKILFVIVLMLALVCVLASCGHEHEFGEWETIRKATCMVDGARERYCSCGEKLSEQIEAIDHTWVEASCSAPETCSSCGETQGTILQHEISNKTSKCVYCGKFEYNLEYAIRGCVKGYVENLKIFTEEWKICNTYVWFDETCNCDYCLDNKNAGEYYMTVIIFSNYKIDGVEYNDVSIYGIHKYDDKENDAHYSMVSYTQEYYYTHENETLTSVWAADNSFCFSDMTAIQKSVLSDILPDTDKNNSDSNNAQNNNQNSSSSNQKCSHASCKINGPFYCMGKNDTCPNQTYCAYDFYCDECD